MEILTLLRSNIRHRKGSFISTALLVFLITAMTLSILSVKKNFGTAIDSAHEYAGSPDVIVYSKDSPAIDDIISRLDSCPEVGKYEVFAAAFPEKNRIRDTEMYNNVFLCEPPEKIRVFNDDFSGFLEDVPELERGEIFFPYGIMDEYKVSVGDTMISEADGKEYSFTIRGFTEEPFAGSPSIGIKMMYIHSDDLAEIRENCRELDAAAEEEDSNKKFGGYINIKIIKLSSADRDMPDGRFMRKVELDTKLISSSEVTLTMSESRRYTSIEMTIISAVVLAFSAILFLIVLTVIAHSIRVEIKIDYLNMGILKSQGFTDQKLTLIIMLRYIIAETVGMMIGILCSVPIERLLSGLFMEITAIRPDRNVAWGYSLLVIVIMLAASALLIIICTRDLSRITPVKAINQGHEDIHFDGIINAPITKHGLSLSLVLRSITSAKKRYIGLTAITAVLIFFMVTANTVNLTLNSRSALESVGSLAPDIAIDVSGKDAYGHIGEAEKIITDNTDIEKKIGLISEYISIDGNSIICTVTEQPELINGMLKGRRPLYDDEVIVTQMAADAYGLKLGDEVMISRNGYTEKYLISGLYQSLSDAGMACGMSAEGGKKLGIKSSAAYYYYISDPGSGDAIADEINDLYGESLKAQYIDYGSENSLEEDKIILAVEVMIYIFSILFVLITMLMICSRTFIQERRDIGIYKAMGFTTARLRIQFSMRFFMVALIGGLLGSVLSLMYTAKALNMMFRVFGVVNIKPEFSTASFITAIVFVSLSVMLFAYLVSGRIKKVSVRELIIE